jgi:chromosome segregation ATPase
VAILKTELETVNEKLSQLSVSAEEPSGNAAATEATRAEHTAEIERLTSAHTEELQSLQARLDEAETQRKELEESSQKDLEEARKSASAQGDHKTLALLDELKATHQTQLAAIEQELLEHKSSAAHFGEQITALKNELELQKTALEEEKARDLDHFNRELKGRDQVMENLNTEIVKLNALKEQEVRAAEQSAEESVSGLREQVASLEAKLATAESATEKNSEQTSSIAEKDQEITDLKQALEKIQSELQEARETAASQLTSKIEELGSAHEAAISQLKAEHDAAVSSLSTSHAEELTLATLAAESGDSEHSQQLQELRDALEASKATAQKGQEDAVAELKAAHEAELMSLQQKLEAAVTTARQGQEDVIAELKSAHETELQSLQEKLEASEASLGDSRRALDEGNASAQDVAVQEIDALRHKCESLESQLATGTGKINALLEEMQSKQAEAEAIHRTLLDVEDHSKQESAQKDNKMKALEEKAAESVFLLDQHTAQAASVSEKHAQALEELKAQHATALAFTLEQAKEASGSHDSALSDLQSKHDELLASSKELESTHAKRVQLIEGELKAALEGHAGEIATHTEGYTELQKQFEETQAKLQAEIATLESSRQADARIHATQIADLQAGFEETKAKLQAELEATQTSKTADSDAEHGKAIEQLLTMQESKLSGLREELEGSNKTKIEELQRAHDAALASVNEQLSQAKAAVQDTSALDSLKTTIAELEGKLADYEKAHIAVQESAASASRDIEGRYAAEIATIQAEHAALTEKYQATVTQVGELQKSALDSDSQKSHLESIMKQLSESRDQLLKVKADNAAISDSLLDCKNQNKILTEKVEADERDLNDQIDKNMGLLERLGDLDSNISAARRRVRELETELAVLKADSGDKSSSSGLGASRWATADEGSENAEDGGPATTEGEDLGPSIEGTVGDPRLKKSSYSSDLPAFHPFI